MRLDPIADQIENIFASGKILVIISGSKLVYEDFMVLIKKVPSSFYYVIMRSMRKNSFNVNVCYLVFANMKWYQY